MSFVAESLDPTPQRPLRIGLLGCGVVGTPVAAALLDEGAGLAHAAGVRLELARVAIAHPAKPRAVALPTELVTTDAVAVAIDPDIDIVIEVIGGIDPPLAALRAALGDNKSVVTANKELLARSGCELFADPRAEIFYEAAVCGAIPIVRSLREACAGDEITCITGILNGTSNYVLWRMTESGCSQDEAVEEARHLGYAEADHRTDIDGSDAAAKLAVLARTAFGVAAHVDDVARLGIGHIDEGAVAAATRAGLVYKLVGTARRTGTGVELSVRPTLIGADHPLARVNGADNAVLVDARKAGRLSFSGAGAGGPATASAVLGDVVAAARRRVERRSPQPACLG